MPQSDLGGEGVGGVSPITWVSGIELQLSGLVANLLYKPQQSHLVLILHSSS